MVLWMINNVFIGKEMKFRDQCKLTQTLIR